MGLLLWIVVGAIAGWLAGLMVRGGGFGFLTNVVVGIVGAAVAGWVLPRLGVQVGGGFFREIFHATIGAVILLVLVSLIGRMTR
ncbi:GlsB/YeaQ/YmgE family stress response membrane protein [Siculibacillus lacustris]|uniref:GlsB/YeaQ/YmgE family stress response membrane protein n=1 Tax=Siculibacillus lacustris TaxID=1549641 RepID=A0A4Q9VJ01_9HYPH|nr:GlsB/YeaQ/YmgE family stress response membrane protein [Siculibacillus lacustris]TBW34316.1 GlsB/YeaQ/YmgE family stress response membrane protein [Siculibacillus lacustris]